MIPLAFLMRYLDPVITACLLYIPAAALFTIPFLVVQYRRFGSVPFLRVVVVYAFILYMLCAFLLTVLPLPDEEKLASMQVLSPQWIPFETYVVMFRRAGFSFAQPETFLGWKHWLGLARSRGLFEILANIVMQIPLGVFLRYYFRRSRRQVLLIGFLVSLFYEITQLTGVFFLYPKAYRLCSVDDLMGNTLGALIGYSLTPLFCAMLPTRERLDEIAMERGRKITYIRRLAAVVIDLAIFLVVPVLALFPGSDRSMVTALCVPGWFAWVLGVYVFGQHLAGGCTLGKHLLKIRLVDTATGGLPSIMQMLIRYGLIFLVLPAVLLAVGLLLLLAVVMVFGSDSAELQVVGLIMAFGLLVGCASWLAQILGAHHGFPHSYLSGTHITHEGADAP